MLKAKTISKTDIVHMEQSRRPELPLIFLQHHNGTYRMTTIQEPHHTLQIEDISSKVFLKRAKHQPYYCVQVFGR